MLEILSRFHHVGATLLPRELRQNLHGLCTVTDGPWRGKVIASKSKDDSLHLCSLSPAGLVYERCLGSPGHKGEHQRVDGLAPFDVPSGPAIELRSTYWYAGRLWCSFQDTYGSPLRPMPSLYSLDFETSPPTLRGPWAFTIPHECTGSQILGVTEDGAHFYATGWDANTFQNGSHGPSLAEIPIPADDDPVCDMTYRAGEGWVEQAEWEHLPARQRLFWPVQSVAWRVPGLKRHSVSMSGFRVPWGVTPDGRLEKGAPDRGWAFVGGAHVKRIPYERGPYYVINHDGEVYAAPGPAGGGAHVMSDGWLIGTQPGDVSHLNPMPTKHWASAIVALDGCPVFLQSYDVLVDSYRHYGEGGEFAYPRPKDGYPHTPIQSRWHAANPYCGGRYYHTQSCGISHRGFQEEVQRKTIMAWRLQDIDYLQLLPAEWEMVEDCWPGYQDARLLRGYINPCHTDGTPKTKRENYDTKVSTMLAHEGFLYVFAVDATDMGGVLNTLEIR